MHIAICDDDYLTCDFIENIVLQYSKWNSHKNRCLPDSKKSL